MMYYWYGTEGKEREGEGEVDVETNKIIVG